jgi:RNA polymerase sigma-70 factor (ECF subfamily)
VSDSVREVADFESFFTCTFPAMLARAIMLCGHRQDAEDAVQEAYAEAVLRWDRVGGYDSAEAWVYKVMTQRLWNRRRRWQRALDAARDMPVPPQSSPEQAAETREVLRLLACLPPAQRMTMVLHCLYGLPQDEIARELGVRRGTVAASIHEGRRKLQQMLGITPPARHGAQEELMAASRRTLASPALWGADPIATLLAEVEARIREGLEGDRAALEMMLRRIRSGDRAADSGVM